ncbi:MAG: eukaryotic-like serine/threonine-protein kinase, partial [Gaiellaceae bacterium]|nr:eukaryotic-like serine/threonine-protein kinase [Gaiellaceae bacterium]
GRFRIVRVLGIGGTGTVFEAIDETNGESIALKAIPRDERLQRRARREMRVAATLDHPAIVRLLDSVEDNDYIYVVFELVRGDDLARAFREGMLDDAAVMRAVAAVCDALTHAHERGVVHRDIKPGNVLLRDDGILKLTDFGIALVSDPDATVDDRLLGTLSYLAPEQALGEDVDGAADVFSSALMLYEALAGANPFRAKTPTELAERHAVTALSLSADRPDLPPVVLRHIDRALQREPKKRPTAPQLRDALLHGARAIERGMIEDEPEMELAEERERRQRKLHRAKKWVRAALPRRRPRLRVVPDPGDTAPNLVQRFVASTWTSVDGDRRAALERVGSAALTGIAASALLGALPFYPVYAPLLLGLVLGVLALRHPLAAAATALLLALPLVGNLSLGLLPGAAAAVLVWLAVTARAPRRAWLPVLAPLAAFAALWPLYLVACATAPRAHIRFVTGAAGPLVITLVCGLGGIPSPLSGVAPAGGLAERISGSESIIRVTDDVLTAVGSGVVVQSLAWGLLALGGLPLLRFTGTRLRWFGAAWLGAGYAATVLGPALVGLAPAPAGLLAAGIGAAAILLALRSVAPEAVAAPDGAT